MDFGELNWVTIGIALAALAVGWTLLKAVLRLTTRVFTLGCFGLLVVGAGLLALNYFGR